MLRLPRVRPRDRSLERRIRKSYELTITAKTYAGFAFAHQLLEEWVWYLDDHFWQTRVFDIASTCGLGARFALATLAGLALVRSRVGSVAAIGGSIHAFSGKLPRKRVEAGDQLLELELQLLGVDALRLGDATSQLTPTEDDVLAALAQRTTLSTAQLTQLLPIFGCPRLSGTLLRFRGHLEGGSMGVAPAVDPCTYGAA